MSSNTKDEHKENMEEGIKVAIRMRPLNSKEGNSEGARVWRVLPKYNSVTQTSSTGKPLSERINGRTFFSFDKTFGEDSTTETVYDSVARGIVNSVVTGLNGTIFAYGQTSSGKTFTMQGDGTIEEGVQNGGGGIVHMAARDIFSHIANDPQRVFLIRVSFVEIYNEEVRDLLVSGNADNVLTIREDPRRGVFVNATENFVTDFQSLLSTLFAGESKRAFASTGMNERSSRSHTIFRVTVESRNRRSTDNDDDDDDDGSRTSKSTDADDDDDDGAVRVSTLNLVDLAGSESARHTGATGIQQKEGGNINRSLLTLSRVIAALGSSNKASHINFRDSKLTRLLQPALSGNSRMAIICCATPSELYLEETRSTLQFASRAKLVKTRATINEVLDDRSLIKKLQKELAEARRVAGTQEAITQLKSLENEATIAETKVKKAEEEIRRLKSSFLRGDIFQRSSLSYTTHILTSPQLGQNKHSMGMHSPIGNNHQHKKRRLSDTSFRYFSDLTNMQTPSPTQLADKKAITEQKHLPLRKQMGLVGEPRSFQVDILKEALDTKADIARGLEVQLKGIKEENEAAIVSATNEIDSLKQQNHEQSLSCKVLVCEKENIERDTKEMSSKYSIAIEEKNATIQQMQARIDQLEKENKDMIECLESTNAKNETTQQVKDKEIEDLSRRVQQLEDQNHELQQQSNVTSQELSANLHSVNEEKVRLLFDLAEANAKKETLQKSSDELTGRIETLSSEAVNLKETIQSSKECIENLKGEESLSNEVANKLSEAEDSALLRIGDLCAANEKIQAQLDTTQSKLATTEDDLRVCDTERKSLLQMKHNLEESLSQLNEKVQNVELDRSLAEALSNEMSAAEDVALKNLVHSEAVIEKLENEKNVLAEVVNNLEGKLDDANVRNALHEDGEMQSGHQLNVLTTVIDQLRNDLEKSEASLVEIRRKKDLAEQLSQKMSDGEDSAVMEVNSLLSRMQELQSGSRIEKELVTEEWTLAERVAQNVSDGEDIAMIEIESLRSTIQEIESQSATEKEKLGEEISKLQGMLEISEYAVKSLENEKQHEQSNNSALETKIADLEEREKSRIVEHTEELESVMIEMEILDKGSNRLKDEKTALENQLEELREKEEVTRVDIETMETDKAVLEEKLIDLESNEKVRNLAEVKSLESDKCRLEEETRELGDQMEQYKHKEQTLKKELEMFKKSAAEKESDLESLLKSLHVKEQFLEERVRTLNDEVESLKVKEMNAKRKLDEQRNQNIITTQKLVDMQQQLEQQLSPEEIEGDTKDPSVLLMETEILDLKQLLASANQREVEALEKVKQSSDELAEKKSEYEQLMKYASERDEAATLAEEKVRDLEKITISSSPEESDLPTQREMEILYEEKLNAEAERDEAVEEISRRKASEEEMRRLAGEERRDLVQKAEDEMNKLSDQLQVAKKDAERFRNDTDSLRQQINSLEGKLRTHEDESMKSSQMNKALNEEISSLDKENIELKEKLDDVKRDHDAYKEYVNKAKESFKIANEKKVVKLSEELDAAKDSFNASERKARSVTKELESCKLEFKQTCADMTAEKNLIIYDNEMTVSKLKEEVAQLKVNISQAEADLYSSRHEAAEYNEKLVRLQASTNNSNQNVSALEQKIGDLQSSIESFKSSEKSLRQLLSSHESKVLELESELEKKGSMGENLMKEIDQLKSDLSSRDAKIRKLRDKTMTKEEIDRIRRVQDERQKYHDMAKDYKKQLQKEREKCKIYESSNKENISAHNESIAKDLEVYKEKNDQLKTKLKKYHSHCKHLEEEKKASIECIKSSISDDDSIDVDNDFCATIVNLCERVNSLEEECNVLINAEKKVVSLQVQIDDLKEKNTTLEGEVEDMKQLMDKNTNEKSKLLASLDDAKRRVTSLEKDKENLKKIIGNTKEAFSSKEHELMRQKSYLEKENLQLIEDLKTLKRKYHAIKNERDNLYVHDEDSTSNDYDITADTKKPLEATRKKDKQLMFDASATNTLMNMTPMHTSEVRKKIGLEWGIDENCKFDPSTIQPLDSKDEGSIVTSISTHGMLTRQLRRRMSSIPAVDDIFVKESKSSSDSGNSSSDYQLSDATITTTNDDQSEGDRGETDSIAFISDKSLKTKRSRALTGKENLLNIEASKRSRNNADPSTTMKKEPTFKHGSDMSTKSKRTNRSGLGSGEASADDECNTECKQS